MDFQEFLDKYNYEYNLEMSTARCHENPHMVNNDKWESDHFSIQFKIYGKGEPRKMGIFWSQGIGHRDKFGTPKRPKRKDVLECLVMDALTIINTQDFEEWANELGYSPDSIKALNTYKAVEKQTKDLKKLFGEDFDALLNVEW